MELRQLTTLHERQVFARCLAEARATRGIGFKERARSRIGEVHLGFGEVYALFDGEEEPAERMKAGFSVHDLGTLPQSYPKPDLTHLRPESVLEGGELWSLSPGAGRVARLAAAAVAGIMQARAIVIYAIVKPVDITHFYAEDNFVNVGEPVRWPYAQTVTGAEIWVQPMMLEGGRLEAYIGRGFDFLFRASGDCRILRFVKPRGPKATKTGDHRAKDSAILPVQSDERAPHNGISAGS
jgi:hypothetical protein